MARIQMPQRNPRPRRIVVVRRRARKFRSWWILIPLILCVGVWFMQNIKPAASWNDVMDFLNVHDRERYSQCAILGVVLCGIAGVARILRDHRRDRDS